MKYLLLEYAEKSLIMTDMSKVKYSYKKNLNILEKTNEPVIDILDNEDIHTTTKVTTDEISNDGMSFYVNHATQTKTLVYSEKPDSDDDIRLVTMSLITMTTTKVITEDTDSD